MSGENLHCTVHCSTQCGAHCTAVYEVGHSALQHAVWGYIPLQHAVLGTVQYSTQCGAQCITACSVGYSALQHAAWGAGLLVPRFNSK
jgi:hypothetical protein